VQGKAIYDIRLDFLTKSSINLTSWTMNVQLDMHIFVNHLFDPMRLILVGILVGLLLIAAASAQPSATYEDWQKANGGWIKVSNDHPYNTEPNFHNCPTQPDSSCRGLTTDWEHGVCINAVTFANSTVAASWTNPGAIVANDCGTQQSGYVVICPDVTEYWVPAGTYTLTEYLHVSEVNNDPLYVPCHNAWSLPSKTVVITPGQTVDFGDGSNLISSANTCTPGSYSCGTAVSKCRCTITAPSSVCSGSTDNTASVSSTSGATYTWSIINGTITAGTGTRTITWTAGKGGPAHLSVSVTSSSCSATCTKDVLVDAPNCNITAPSSVCSGSTDNTASVQDAGYGVTYDWSINGGSITAGAGTNEITWTAGKGGPAHLSVSVTSSSCSATCTKDVLVDAPNCNITAPSSVCSGSTDNTASVQDAGYGVTYDWSINGGSITAGAGTNEITWTAGDAGIAQISVTVTDSNGCSATCTKDVSVKAPPDCTITSASPVSSGSSNTASVQDAGYGVTYDWSINGGSITAGAGTNEITWTAGDTGMAQISVTVIDSYGCSATCTKEVTVTAQGYTPFSPTSNNPTGLPGSLQECETSLTSTSKVCGTWTLQGDQYYANWENGDIATLNVDSWGASGVVITRYEAGLSGRYEGQLNGNTIDNGKATWTWNGSTYIGTWNANW